jgi:hypothetical protein
MIYQVCGARQLAQRSGSNAVSRIFSTTRKVIAAAAMR